MRNRFISFFVFQVIAWVLYLPAIILTSAKGDHHYQIITSEDHSLNVREVNNKIEFARNLDQSSDLERLFSSSALHP